MANLPVQENGTDSSSRLLTSRNKNWIAIVPPSTDELRASAVITVPHQVRPPETSAHTEEEEDMVSFDFASFNIGQEIDDENIHARDSSPHLDRERGNSTCYAPSNYSFDIQQIYNRPEKYKFGEMASYQERLRSFDTWPLCSPRGMDLAAANMFYQGPIVHNGEIITDQVICYKCGQSFRGWEPDDNPVVEHMKIYPECFYTKWKEEL